MWRLNPLNQNLFGLGFWGMGRTESPHKSDFAGTLLGPRSYLTISYLYRGAGYFQRENEKPQAVEAGQLLIRLPGHSYKLGPDRDGKWGEYWFVVGGFVVDEWLRRQYIDDRLHAIPVRPAKPLEKRLERCLRLSQKDRWDDPIMTETLSYIFSLIFNAKDPEPSQATGKKKDRLFERIRVAMERNLGSPKFEIHQMDPPTNLSYHTVRAAFRRFSGNSLQDYFRRLKVKAASSRLASTEDKIQDIAQALGYDDPFEFSKIFRKIQGISPREFRRKLIASPIHTTHPHHHT